MAGLSWMRAVHGEEEPCAARLAISYTACPPATILRAADLTLGRPEGSLDARQMQGTAATPRCRASTTSKEPSGPSAFGDKGLMVQLSGLAPVS